MKVPYLIQPASPALTKIFSKTQIFKPLITVVLRKNEKKRKLFALVDSGADACLFPPDVAEILEIDIKKGERADFVGIGSTKTTFYFHEVEILLGEYQVKTKVGFSTSAIGVGGVLGQQGFFEHFLVSFDHKNRYVEIKRPNFLHDLTSKLSP